MESKYERKATMATMISTRSCRISGLSVSFRSSSMPVCPNFHLFSPDRCVHWMAIFACSYVGNVSVLIPIVTAYFSDGFDLSFSNVLGSRLCTHDR